jgi:hypothetical protein
MENFAGDEPFQTPQHIFFGEPVGSASPHVGDGAWVESQSDDGDHVQGTVGLAVSAAVQPHPKRPTRGDEDGCHPAQPGKGGFAAQSVDVLTGGDEKLSRGQLTHHLDCLVDLPCSKICSS